MDAPRVVAVVGPTATGKSALGVELARAIGGEIVNADSMQLYRGMDIGTAKLPPDARGGVPHHLLDVWDVTETASVADYQQRARACIERIRSDGRVPILVGGSGLYVTAVMDDVDFPGTDPNLRASLEAELDRIGPAALHARLAELDEPAAAAILPSNGRRIVRALEVRQLTGEPFRARLAPEPAYPDVVLIGLRMDRSLLDQRIERRVATMFEAGLVEEVRRLQEAGLRRGKTASRALGYAQVLGMLDGRYDVAAARAATVRATRRLARRQEAWWARDERIAWFDAAAPMPELLAAAVEAVQNPPRGAMSGSSGVAKTDSN